MRRRTAMGCAAPLVAVLVLGAGGALLFRATGGGSADGSPTPADRSWDGMDLREVAAGDPPSTGPSPAPSAVDAYARALDRARSVADRFVPPKAALTATTGDWHPGDPAPGWTRGDVYDEGIALTRVWRTTAGDSVVRTWAGSTGARAATPAGASADPFREPATLTLPDDDALRYGRLVIGARHLDASHSEVTVGVLAGWSDPVPARDPRIGTPMTLTGIRACPPALTGAGGTVDVPLTVRNLGYRTTTQLLPDEKPSGAFVCGNTVVNGRVAGRTDRRLGGPAATRLADALRGISTSRLHGRQPFPPADTSALTTIVLTYDVRDPVMLFFSGYEGLSNGTIVVGTPRWPPDGYPESSGYWHSPGGEVLDRLDALLGAGS